MEYIAIFGTIAIISLLAAMSPGPDFIVVTKNSFSGSRAIGLCTALGVGLGIMSHVTYSLIGIGFIISQSIILFTIKEYGDFKQEKGIFKIIQNTLGRRECFVSKVSC